MEYKNEELKVTFTVPDKVTVRQQLAYYSEAARAAGQDLFIRLWYGARVIIEDWQCEIMPDRMVDLDDITSPSAAAAITWASGQVRQHMDRLEDIPKNS